MLTSTVRSGSGAAGLIGDDDGDDDGDSAVDDDGGAAADVDDGALSLISRPRPALFAEAIEPSAAPEPAPGFL